MTIYKKIFLLLLSTLSVFGSFLFLKDIAFTNLLSDIPSMNGSGVVILALVFGTFILFNDRFNFINMFYHLLTSLVFLAAGYTFYYFTGYIEFIYLFSLFFCFSIISYRILMFHRWPIYLMTTAAFALLLLMNSTTLLFAFIFAFSFILAIKQSGLNNNKDNFYDIIG